MDKNYKGIFLKNEQIQYLWSKKSEFQKMFSWDSNPQPQDYEAEP